MRGVLAVVALISAISACGAPVPVHESESAPLASQQTPPNIDELLGPWSATPLPLDAATVSEMDAQCLAFDLMAPGVSLVVVDARGEGRVFLQYAGEDGHEGNCEATIHADGTIDVHPPSHTVRVQEVVPVGDHELRVRQGFGSPGSAARADWWIAHIGQAGAGIDRVIAEVPGYPSPVVASMGDGWFVVWWPIQVLGESRLVGLDAAGEEVATLTLSLPCPAAARRNTRRRPRPPRTNATVTNGAAEEPLEAVVAM